MNIMVYLFYRDTGMARKQANVWPELGGLDHTYQVYDKNQCCDKNYAVLPESYLKGKKSQLQSSVPFVMKMKT